MGGGSGSTAPRGSSSERLAKPTVPHTASSSSRWMCVLSRPKARVLFLSSTEIPGLWQALIRHPSVIARRSHVACRPVLCHPARLPTPHSVSHLQASSSGLSRITTSNCYRRAEQSVVAVGRSGGGGRLCETNESTLWRIRDFLEVLNCGPRGLTSVSYGRYNFRLGLKFVKNNLGEMDPLVQRRLRSILEHLLPPETSQVSSDRFVSLSPTANANAAQEDIVFVPGDFAKTSLLSSRSQYEQLYKEAIDDPDAFWGRVAAGFFWQTHWDKSKPVCNHNFDVDKGPIFVEWFKGGYTNACYNALDRHVVAGYGHQMCFLWEGNDPGQSSYLTYSDVLKKVCQVANFLRARGVKMGDRVCIYMSMITELPIAMLACARIGAVHSVVFGGFSSESLAGRILDCQAKVVLTCSAGRRGTKLLPLKEIVDHALQICLKEGNFRVETCLVYDNNFAIPREKVPWTAGRDIWWQETINQFAVNCPVQWMEAEDPLFMLYTSGSTGKPKGLIHTVGGYMVYAGFTFKHTFDHKAGDIFWCTADCGWITGHTYVTYGPLFNRATCVIFEGVPTFPDAGRWWEIVDKYRVTTLYAAPTAIRTLAGQGDEIVKKYSRKSLRLLGSVGEPISPKTWRWFYEVCGDSRCPIVDTWWQTETGGSMISSLPGAWPMKPGCASLPFFGVQLVVLDQEGKEQHGPCEGYLCIKAPWPAIARTVNGDHGRYESTYFKTSKGLYTTGDGCRRDADGFIWITGRVDDVLNVSGHRISTGEVEGALVSHPQCTEAAVVGYDHDVKGQGIYAFVTLSHDAKPSDALKKQLQDTVRKQIGAFAAPEVIHWAAGLPKTRSGKIMRRILRKIAARQYSDIGDTSSLADPSVVEALIKTVNQL